MKARVVVDASIAVKWLVPENQSDRAWIALNKWQDEGTCVCAPHLPLSEVSNAMLKRINKSEYSLVAATNSFEMLLSVNLNLADMPRDSLRAIELATDHLRPSVYDSQYLALA